MVTPVSYTHLECHFSSFRFGILLHPCSAIEAIFIGHHIILLISEINYCLDTVSYTHLRTVSLDTYHTSFGSELQEVSFQFLVC